MSNTSDRVATRTILSFGLAEAPIALFKTTAESRTQSPWVKAGPHGGVLERGAVKGGKRVPVEELLREEPISDPLALPESALALPAEVGELDPEAPPMTQLPPIAEPAEIVTVGILEHGYDDELTEEEVRRGYIVREEFIDLTEQIEEIETSTKLEKMEVVAFVRREQVPRDRISGSYYLGGDGFGAPKVLRLLFEAMHKTQRVALVKWTKRTRQALGVITPKKGRVLEVLELEWAQNVLEPGERCLTHLEAKVTPGEVEAATRLAYALADSGAAIDEQEDDRVRLERVLLERAATGQLSGFTTEMKPEAPVGATLEELLAASVAAVTSE